MGTSVHPFKSRQMSGLIVHNGNLYAGRLNNGVFEWSDQADPAQVIRAAMRAGALLDRRRRRRKRSALDNIQKLPLKLYCVGVSPMPDVS